jgi:hypothetical protein
LGLSQFSAGTQPKGLASESQHQISLGRYQPSYQQISVPLVWRVCPPSSARCNGPYARRLAVSSSALMMSKILATDPVILAGLVKAVGLVVIQVVALIEAQGVTLADPGSAVLFSQENPLISLVILGTFTYSYNVSRFRSYVKRRGLEPPRKDLANVFYIHKKSASWLDVTLASSPWSLVVTRGGDVIPKVILH